MPPKKGRSNKRDIRKVIRKEILSSYEKKQADITGNALAIHDAGRTPLTYDILNIGGGTSQNQRIGNSVRLVSIYSEFTFNVFDTYNICRMVLYIPFDSDDNLETDQLTPYQMIDQDRYTVLYDRLINLSTYGVGTKRIVLKRNFTRGGRSRGINVHWSTGTATDFTKNRVKLYIVSDSSVAADPSVTFHLRAYYTDA